MDVSQLTPRRPYLLRAFYDWLSLSHERSSHRKTAPSLRR
ncbi:hypothetical protein ACLBPT_30350, partial [Klebsiella pneumoniae]